MPKKRFAALLKRLFLPAVRRFLAFSGRRFMSFTHYFGEHRLENDRFRSLWLSIVEWIWTLEELLKELLHLLHPQIRHHSDVYISL